MSELPHVGCSSSVSSQTMPIKKKKDRMPAVVIGAAVFGSFGACFGAIIGNASSARVLQRLMHVLVNPAVQT